MMNDTALVAVWMDLWVGHLCCFRLRLAGLHGLQGVVRKTVTDDLQCNIWKPVHMDKIIPSLLFNMQDAR